MNKWHELNRQKRHNLVRLGIAAAALILIIVYENLEWNWQIGTPRGWWATLDAFLLALLGALAYFSVDRILRMVDERQALKEQLARGKRAERDAPAAGHAVAYQPDVPGCQR